MESHYIHLKTGDFERLGSRKKCLIEALWYVLRVQWFLFTLKLWIFDNAHDFNELIFKNISGDASYFCHITF